MSWIQVLMFSATLHSQEVKDAAAKICQQPIVVDLKVCLGLLTSLLNQTKAQTMGVCLVVCAELCRAVLRCAVLCCAAYVYDYADQFCMPSSSLVQLHSFCMSCTESWCQDCE